jgi:hypothetical protein
MKYLLHVTVEVFDLFSNEDIRDYGAEELIQNSIKQPFDDGFVDMALPGNLVASLSIDSMEVIS